MHYLYNYYDMEMCADAQLESLLYIGRIGPDVHATK